MNYETFFRRELDGLRREGNYRVFADLQRRAGSFPRATHIRDRDRSEVTVSVEAPPGASLEYTRFAAENVARQVRTHRDVVAYTYTTVGSASGTGAVDAASVYVRLKPKADRDVSQQEFSANLRRELRRIGGANAFILESGGPNGGQRQVQLQLQGTESATLARLADTVAAIARTVPGAVDVACRARGRSPSCAWTCPRRASSPSSTRPCGILRPIAT